MGKLHSLRCSPATRHEGHVTSRRSRGCARLGSFNWPFLQGIDRAAVCDFTHLKIQIFPRVTVYVTHSPCGGCSPFFLVPVTQSNLTFFQRIFMCVRSYRTFLKKKASTKQIHASATRTQTSHCRHDRHPGDGNRVSSILSTSSIPFEETGHVTLLSQSAERH